MYYSYIYTEIYIPVYIYNDIYISYIYHIYLGVGPNKNTLDPLRDGINLSIKVPKGTLIWHPTVLQSTSTGTCTCTGSAQYVAVRQSTGVIHVHF